MQDGSETSQIPAANAPSPSPYPSAQPPRRGGTALLVALLAFVAGAGLAGWLVWQGSLDEVLPAYEAAAPAPAPTVEPPIAPQVFPQPPAVSGETLAGLSGVETRLALLEDRFSRIDHAANAADANASRAESLLIAFAARRMIDKGQPLGYLEDQIKLRFGDAQPQAVQTIVNASREPVTLYLLSSQLEAATPALAGARRPENSWDKLRRELASLFVVRRSAYPAAKPIDRAERAQLLLRAGKIEDAIAEVERLPGAENAQGWIATARRYDATQRALDLIETAAMLEPRQPREDNSPAQEAPPTVQPTDAPVTDETTAAAVPPA